MSSYTADKGEREVRWMRDWHARLCAGNADALAWLTAWWDFSAVLDDLVDGDRPRTPADVAEKLFAFWTVCALSPWFAVHRAALWQPVADSIMRWQLGDAGRAGAALKAGDAGVFLAVGIICGGWTHALAVLREKLPPGGRAEEASLNCQRDAGSTLREKG